jgi:hypothetical protein
MRHLVGYILSMKRAASMSAFSRSGRILTVLVLCCFSAALLTNMAACFPARASFSPPVADEQARIAHPSHDSSHDSSHAHEAAVSEQAPIRGCDQADGHKAVCTMLLCCQWVPPAAALSCLAPVPTHSQSIEYESGLIALLSISDLFRPPRSVSQ